MSTAAVTIRYDGPILADHRMDVADLAPALLGISELCKIANRRFNADRAAVKVLIGTDVEHKCFQLDLHVIQSVWDQTKAFISSEEVKSAKDFLEWLGILGIPTGGGVVGLFQLLKRLKGGKITSTTLETREGRNVVRIEINGDNNNKVVIVPPETLDLLRDEDAVANAKRVVQPLLKDGYESVEFESENKIVDRIEKHQAVAIASLDPSTVEETEKGEPQTIRAWISVYSPVYDVKAPKWRFKFGDAHEYMDISETDIVEAAMRRGGAMVDDAYFVELEIIQERKSNNTFSNTYKIKRVLDFRPARLPHQTDAFKGHN
jgi:DNA-binding protein YbaB